MAAMDAVEIADRHHAAAQVSGSGTGRRMWCEGRAHRNDRLPQLRDDGHRMVAVGAEEGRELFLVGIRARSPYSRAWMPPET